MAKTDSSIGNNILLGLVCFGMAIVRSHLLRQAHNIAYNTLGLTEYD